jgi:hypothetical protein
VESDDAPVRVEGHTSEETVEIFVEADFETRPEERRRFAIINIPRHLISEATGQRRIVNAAAAHSVPLPSSGRRHRCLAERFSPIEVAHIGLRIHFDNWAVHRRYDTFELPEAPESPGGLLPGQLALSFSTDHEGNIASVAVPFEPLVPHIAARHRYRS